MKIIHIMGCDKFAPGFIDLVNTNFKNDKHVFYLLCYDTITKESRTPYQKWNNVVFVTKTVRDILGMAKPMKTADKIIFHGLFSKLIMFMVCLCGVSEKTYCALWGGDLYKYSSESKVEFLMKKHIISRCKGIIMELEADYNLAKKWYGATSPYFECMLYLSNIVEDSDKSIHINSGEEIVIQVGNSADPSNNHKEVLEKLKKYKEEKIKLIIPLSYGVKEYAEEIDSYCKSVFGSKANTLLDLLPLEDYLNLLDEVDIAIFAHNRQQALGNVLTLLSKGKKVYLKRDGTMYQSLTKLGIKLFDTDEVDQTVLNRISFNDALSNSNIVYSISNIQKLISDWKRVFSD